MVTTLEWIYNTSAKSYPKSMAIFDNSMYMTGLKFKL